MLTLLASAFEQLLWVLLLTGLLGAGIVRFGFPDRGRAFCVGLGRVALSFFQAPVLRLRQAIALVSDAKPDHDVPAPSNRQYLLNKVFVVAECLLVLSTTKYEHGSPVDKGAWVQLGRLRGFINCENQGRE